MSRKDYSLILRIGPFVGAAPISRAGRYGHLIAQTLLGGKLNLQTHLLRASCLPKSSVRFLLLVQTAMPRVSR
jgi:hypothetical protein